MIPPVDQASTSGSGFFDSNGAEACSHEWSYARRQAGLAKLVG